MRFAGKSYSNGSVPSAVLAEVLPSGRHGVSRTSRAYLRRDAAASWNRAVAEVRSGTGLDLTVRGWNRSLAEQRRFFLERYRPGAHSPFGDYRRYGGSTYGRVRGAAAAVPGYSNHGWALAVDVNDFGGVGEFGNARRVRAFPILQRHGWTDTEGRRVREPWHLVYSPTSDVGARRRAPTARRTRAPRRPPTIRPGCPRSSWTRLWKEFLTAEGDFGGRPGPVFGEALADATRRWQRRAGLHDDAVVGPRTWYRAVQGARYQGTGARVKIAQRIAGLRGQDVDGRAGPVFLRRWKQIQRWLGVVPDASIGHRTVAALVLKG
ncbi:hypothetical protein GCM10009718_23240 [Isoptericola halotolerans]